jgi:type I restriction enzyme S subunit
MMTSHSAGSVILTIYTEQLEKFPLPRLSFTLEELIHNKIVESFRKRSEYRKLSRLAALKALEVNHLKPLPEENEEVADCFNTPGSLLQTHGAECRLDAHFHNPIARRASENVLKCPSGIRTLSDVTSNIRMSPLFVRKYVAEEHGIRYIAGKQVSQIRPQFKYISRSQTEDLDEHILRAGWTLITCAGTIGKIGYVSSLYDGAAAQDLMRVVPNENEIDGGYLNAWLSSEYGRVLMQRCRYGSVIDRISPAQTASILIPVPSRAVQSEIGDQIRLAHEKRVEALKLEDEAQEILMQEVKGIAASADNYV